MTKSNPSFSLNGRKALVTGASRGIGQALAIGLARAGAHVALAARHLDSLRATEKAVIEAGRKSVAIAADVREVAAARWAVDDAREALDGLDILINNAGVEQVSDSLDVDEALWDRIL